MAVVNAKFSTFADGGDLQIDDIVVGLRNGVNTRFSYQGGSGVYLPLAGGTMTGAIDMGTHKITSLDTPTSGTDAVNKNYVDSAVTGVSPLTTKGDLYTFTTVNARLAVGTTDGQILQVDSAAATGLAWSTTTYPTTTTINQLLFSSAANTVTGLATANSAMLSTDSSGVPSWSASLTDGQIMIGATGGDILPGEITGGAGISVTLGANTIEISSSGSGIGWNSIAGTTQAAAVDSGYYCANTSATTITLPATCALGQVVLVEGTASGGNPWILTANTGQTIQIGSSATSSGGTLTAAAATDNIEVVCIVQDTTWRVQRTNSAGLTIA